MSIVINNSSLTLTNSSVSIGVSSVLPPIGLPDAPTITDVVPPYRSNNPQYISYSVYLTMGSDNGYPLSDIEWSIDGGLTFTSYGLPFSTPLTINLPQDGSIYDLIIRTKNEIGYSPNSNAYLVDSSGYADSNSIHSTIVPSNTCCGGGEVSITDVQLNNWNGGLPIVELRYTIDGGFNWTSVIFDPPLPLEYTPYPFETPIVISGLTNGVEYPIQIMVGNQNNVDDNTWIGSSQIYFVTPSTIPVAPTLDSIYNDGNTISLYFTLNGDGGSPVTYMDFSYQDSYWSSGFSTTSPLTVTGWSPGITYDFGVRAVNVNGVSATSNIIRTQGWAQNAPTLTSVNSGDGSLDVYFTLNDNVNLDPTIDVQYSIDNEYSWVSIGTITSPFTITGLTNGYLYEVRLRTDNGYFGPRSNMISGTPSE